MLIEGVKYYAENPAMIGKTFLRLERDFDKHVNYCRDEPNAQDFLANNDEVRDFFEVSSIQFITYKHAHIIRSKTFLPSTRFRFNYRFSRDTLL